MGRDTPCDLLAIDLDGTLLDSQHRVPPENRAALHRAHEAGIRIVLCTGRSYPETRPILEQIGLDLDAAITVFGALLTDARTGQTLERTPFELNLARRLTAWLQQRGFAVSWLHDGAGTGFDGYIVDGPRRHAGVDGWLERTPCRIRCVAELPADAPAPLRISIIDERELLATVSSELGRDFDGEVAHNLLWLPAYDLTIVEAFAPQVNKWYGIERLCQRWGLDPRRTVAVGDDVNDLAMVARAGLGVAMGNAPAEVKRIARKVVADNDSCGVAALIGELLDG